MKRVINLPKLIAIIATTIIGITVFGCDSKSTMNTDKPLIIVSDGAVVKELPPRADHFQSHYKGAKEFSRLWTEWTKLRESGNYNKALELLEHAYNDVAFGKAEKGIALWETAKTYEAMNDYELAANFYEGAAKTTMNPEQAEEFNAKAAALREKIETN